MDYQKLINEVQSVSKEDIKKVIFEVDQSSIEKVKSMEIDDDIKKQLIEILKNRTFVDLLLVNALK